MESWNVENLVAITIMITLALIGCDQPPPQSPVNEPVPPVVWQEVKPLPAGAPEPEDLDPWDENLELTFEADKNGEFATTHGQAIKHVWTGKVTAVTDGDMIKVLNDQNQEIKIRFNSIDAPEKKQPFGQAAKQYLSDKIFGKRVTVYETGKDRYGRTLAFITLHGFDVNARMVADGYAWEYDQYSKSETLGGYEAKARTEKRGLWAADVEPVPPWEWRQR